MSARTVRNGSSSSHEVDPIVLGKTLADSGYFRDARQAAQAAVKVMAGRELGFPPVASMTGVYIVEGKVTLSAQLMAAAIKRSGHYSYRVAEHTDTECEVVFLERSGDALEEIGRSKYTMTDAQRAGLAGRGPWKQHPRNMLFARALSNGAKWHCPDVFGGPIYTPDELGAEVDGESGQVLTVPSAPEQDEPIAGTVIEQEPAPALSPGEVRALLKLAKQAIADDGPWTKELLIKHLVGAGATDTGPRGNAKTAIQTLSAEQAVQFERTLTEALETHEEARAQVAAQAEAQVDTDDARAEAS